MAMQSIKENMYCGLESIQAFGIYYLTEDVRDRVNTEMLETRSNEGYKKLDGH